MSRPGRPCTTPGCPHLQPCPAHPRIPWAGSTRAQRLPPNWAQLRRRVFHRDGHRCTWILDNGRRCPARATEIDHRDPGDDHRMSNLQSLCTPHHKQKTTAEGHAARRQIGRPS